MKHDCSLAVLPCDTCQGDAGDPLELILTRKFPFGNAEERDQLVLGFTREEFRAHRCYRHLALTMKKLQEDRSFLYKHAQKKLREAQPGLEERMSLKEGVDIRCMSGCEPDCMRKYKIGANPQKCLRCD